jgi:hypothetical protein
MIEERVGRQEGAPMAIAFRRLVRWLDAYTLYVFNPPQLESRREIARDRS